MNLPVMVSVVSRDVLFVVNFTVSTVVMVAMGMGLVSFVVEVTTSAAKGDVDESEKDQEAKGKSGSDDFGVHGGRFAASGEGAGAGD